MVCYVPKAIDTFVDFEMDDVERHQLLESIVVSLAVNRQQLVRRREIDNQQIMSKVNT